jgi:hypothetical protein
LREEHRLRVLENRVLRKIFGPKGDEVRAEWRILHNEELYDLNSPPDIIRVMKKNEMGGVCGTCGRQERCIQGFGPETGGKESTWKT